MGNSWRRRSPFTKKKFHPYALAIGQFGLAWNDLHEALGLLFVEATHRGASGIASGIRISAVWGSVTSDRQKRLMLEAAINWTIPAEHKKSPRIAEDVLWLISRGHSLEDKRNDVIHAPLGEIENALAAGMMGIQMGEIVPTATAFNKRARNLGASTRKTGKRLLPQIRLYRDYASAMAAFARALDREWKHPTGSWPEKPALPRL
jgi:hypothetical protein